MILTGALVNGIAIVAGGLAGTFGGKLMPERMKQTLLTAAALLAMGIGISGLSSSNNQLIPILSLILGTIVGELLNIEHAVERMGAWLQKKFSGMGRITEGFVTGMAAKMFTVAGPVITFGTLASVIYGVILMLLK